MREQTRRQIEAFLAALALIALLLVAVDVFSGGHDDNTTAIAESRPAAESG